MITILGQRVVVLNCEDYETCCNCNSKVSDSELELDDPDEPIMPGSDDEFSDLEEVGESDSAENDLPGPPTGYSQPFKPSQDSRS